MKLRRSLPTLVSSLIALSAVSLFLSTAVSRHSTAKARRLAAEAAALDATRRDGEPSDPSSKSVSPRQPLSSVARDAAWTNGCGPCSRSSTFSTGPGRCSPLMKDFTSDDFRIAMDATPPFPDGGLTLEFERMLDEWRERDPQAAIVYLGPKIPELASGGSATVGSADPDAALRWVREQAATDPLGKRMGAVIASLIARDPETAIEELSNLNPETRKETLTAILSSNNATTREAILHWLDSLADSPSRQQPPRISSGAGLSSAPDQRFALLKRNPEILTGQSMEGIFSQWQQVDPAPHGRLSTRFPQGAPVAPLWRK